MLRQTVASAIREIAARLDGIADNPRREARLLVAHALGLTQNDLIRDPNRQIDPAAHDHLVGHLVERRIGREPLALILGRREFWSLDFQVSPATLIPRADSETLIEAAVAAFSHRPQPRTIIDLGTGTGCLLLALLTEFPSAFGIGVDLSPDAAALAAANARHLRLSGRSAFFAGNWADAVSGRFDLVVSNPPYIPGSDIQTLMPEVARHEPVLALDGGVDGYDAYRAILPVLHELLVPRGISILELGCGQANYVSGLALNAGFDPLLRVDLAAISRAIVLTRLNP